MEKLYYSIGEVAEILGEAPSLVRFWTNTFSRFLKPSRNGKGNRQYKAEEVEVLKQIHLLVKDKGLTLEGAAKQLAEGRQSVSNSVKALESLKAIREQLVEIKENM